MHFSQPRTHYMEDVEVDAGNTIPVFLIEKAVPVFREGGMLDGVETEMMHNRFRVFVFPTPIPKENLRECPPCPRCFVDFILPHASAPLL